jgi:SAM-dependent methyltransferase
MGSLTRLAPLHRIDKCRSCGSDNLASVIAFGETPIADRLVPASYSEEEYVAPLTLLHCTECGLCQIAETVDPAVLFGKDYPYYSSVSPALLAHFKGSADAILDRYNLGADDLVVEPASNDGYMLENFQKAGVQTLGIDPAAGPVSVAREKGIETIHDFFTLDLAKELAVSGKRASVVLANNVLAHVPNPGEFVEGIAVLLRDDGVAVFEFPYLVDLVEKRAFDTIYHQHLLYLSATSVSALFEKNGLYLNDVERTTVHGGSLRVTASKGAGASQAVVDMLQSEADAGLLSADYYDAFCAGLEGMRTETRAAIEQCRANGKRIIGYGAAAKATTLLHYFGITKSNIDCIVDKSTWKQGLEMPVVRIPIVSPDHLDTVHPDVVLILAWNFAREIAAENTAVSDAGGVFLVPVPSLREVSVNDAGASL